MELYVHIPFCVRKCRYCDFASFASGRSQMEEYVSLLLKEAELASDEYGHPEISTVYIGGGTPSILPPDLTDRLLSGLFSVFSVTKDAEISVEANPGTVTDPWLDACLSHGINRFSLGMQAAQDRLLEMLGRIHRMDDVIRSVSLLRSHGVSNFNLDLMFGLPGQSLHDWLETVTAALSLEPSHLSCYGLIPEENTPLKADLDHGRLVLPEPETERTMYYEMRDLLRRNGFRQYEISNFARPGFECRHNIGYWTQVPYIGLGLSAASMANLRQSDGVEYDRVTNTAEYAKYKTEVCFGNYRLRSGEHINTAEARFETVMLGLRLTDGISNEFFRELHGCTMESVWPEVLRSMTDRGLMIRDGNRWKLTELGMDLQNTVLVEFMP